MKINLFLLLLLPLFGFSQDAYHESLLNNLSTTYGLDGGSFIFPNTEEDVIASMYEYGNIMVENKSIENMDFSLAKNIIINNIGNNPWDAGVGIVSQTNITQGDLILVSFWARQNTNTGQVFVLAEENINFEKEFYFPTSFTPDWTQYFIAFRSSSNFNVGRLQIGFHLASSIQDIEIAGLNAINYKNAYNFEDLPSSFSPFDYEGRELDAPWRALAQSRIESIRKSNLTIEVVDTEGNPVEDADIKVEMQQHEFGFGSALVTCRFPGNNCYDETYVDKVLDLDGKGHGFNECVNENALKWRGWEQEWLGTPEETVGAFRWLSENGIKMRGHNLIWPGSDYLPSDIVDNLDDLDYLRTRIHNRLDEMVNHPELRNYIRDWDVLNEITTNRTLESAFNNDPTLSNGRKLYNEIFNKVRELDPDLELYINDYMAISSGSANLVARYKMFLDELKADNVPFDGIGFQCHIGSIPNSIPQVEQIFNDFYQRYGKRMKVTEYDINGQVDEVTQADYMRDLLTLTFSHPGMDAFIMWGFWDGNHWKNNAPLYNLDWTLKPSGEVFIEKVFEEWWTNETALSDSNGAAIIRAFKGDHKITVTKGQETVTSEVTLTSDSKVTIQLSDATSVNELDKNEFTFFPNPVHNNQFTIHFSDRYKELNLQIFDSTGRQVTTYQNVWNGQKINIDVTPGVYQVRGIIKENYFLKSIIVQ